MSVRTLAHVIVARSEIQAAIAAVSHAALVAEELDMKAEASVLASALHPLLEARKAADERIARARRAGAEDLTEV